MYGLETQKDYHPNRVTWTGDICEQIAGESTATYGKVKSNKGEREEGVE